MTPETMETGQPHDPPHDPIDTTMLIFTLSAIAKGDFSVRMPPEKTGVTGKIYDALNQITDLLESTSKEVIETSAVIGQKGILSKRMIVPDARGSWMVLSSSINTMIEDLSRPTTEIARVIGAVAKGDLSQTVPVEVEGQKLKGEFMRVAKTVNTMVDQLGVFSSEVTRVAKEVGSEGKLGGQAVVQGLGGVWKDLTDNVNMMANNLTSQVRNIAEVTIAVANGDFSKKIAVDVRGEMLLLKEAINTMVDSLSTFADEVTRVAREVGSDGKLGGQAVVKGVAGVWKDLTDNVNMMADNLTSQVRNIAEVTTAVARGDLTRKITVDVRGEMQELKETINTMVDQLGIFADEVTRVAREVGTEGKLGGQGKVPGIAGVWKDLTDNVNMMANNLTSQVRNIAEVTTAVASGDLAKKITVDVKGEMLNLKETINTMVDQLGNFADEVTRVAKEVGSEGKLGGQAKVKGVAGVWKDLTENVNMMAENLTTQVRNIAEVTTAVAKGDLNRKITVVVKGEMQELKETINTMVDSLSTFADEVTRVAREVGTEGKLGVQGRVPGVAGVWKDLTDNVNTMAANLTNQVRNIAEVTTAVAKGDLNRKITVDVKGELLELKETVNTMVDSLSTFADEVTRVAREVGTDGKLGGQARVPDVAGVWKDLTDSVNIMASNLTDQVRNIAEVTSAVAKGDLNRKITVDASGEILRLKETMNVMVGQLSTFAEEVTRVAREVGIDGQLGGQAEVLGVAGVWKTLTDNVNMMAANLTDQVRNIAEVTTAVAKGDLTRKITVDAKGEVLRLKETINVMVGQLSTFAEEVIRVTREVGTDGKLGGQGNVPGVAGVWTILTDNVNIMAANLTSQVRNIAEVTTAVAKGDLTKKITVDAKGEIQELKETINTMVDQLGTFAGEVTRVVKEVGTDGKLGGQAIVPDVGGVWKDLTDNVNTMGVNLTNQVRNIAVVTTAVAKGDLARKITVDVKGEFLQLKETINTMVDQLGIFAAEVTRVAREVGTDGKLGGQAEVLGVAGVWKDLTDNVNTMAVNLTSQVRNIAGVTTAVAKGELTRKITVDVKGEFLQLKETINTMVDQLSIFASEVTRVAREVGTDGKLGGQADVPEVAGVWKNLTDNVNMMAANLTSQVRNIAAVTTSVAKGDLTRKITVDVKGEFLELKETINTMVDQLNSFASEVTRVAREVGTDGKLGGQADVPGVAGTWKNLTDSVNTMASNLTDQVRGIATVVTAVANGDLAKKLTVQARGEIASLAETINSMIGTLAVFADQVTSVAREVGVEGRLGGQAVVKGVAGTWKDLTDNVNSMAANLTTQVRAIAEVATAVTKGDLTRSIKVEALGEMEALRNTINEMIANLRETTQTNSEQDWLKTNLAKFNRMLQGQRDLMAVARMILSELAKMVKAQHGVFYVIEHSDDAAGERITLLATYAYKERKNLAKTFKIGEGLVGQCVFEKERILLTNVPEDYIQISSGLGEATPLNIVVLPILFENQAKAVIELASFERFSQIHLNFLEQLAEGMGIVMNTIEANMKTEKLLEQSQSMTEELQSQQQELQQANEELEEKALLLADQKTEVERKNLEVEQAKEALEEKAAQLSLTSKYKSEFLSNMSHELRTPLNSLLILAKQLSDNDEHNLSDDQVKYARNINESGNDLLNLINDILDLAKIESGTVELETSEIFFSDIADSIERTFRPMAVAKNLEFGIEIDHALPRSVHSDSKRLLQVLKNLLSNAFKFTEKGSVTLQISKDMEALGHGKPTVAFSVVDTGIGIPVEKQKIVFEAFQQADGSTSRKYGGSGLGLSISRELAHLLCGELGLQKSIPGKGSVFVLYLPMKPESGPESSKTGSSIFSSRPVPYSSLPGQPPAAQMVKTDRAQKAGITQDDRENIKPGDNVALIVEDDPRFAEILMSAAREKGFKCVVTQEGEPVPELAANFGVSAITLDINLPDTDGWTVLDRLKMNPNTRHIPVHIMTVENEKTHGLKHGAFGYLTKPLTMEAIKAAFSDLKNFIQKDVKNLLIIENDDKERAGIVKLIGNGTIKTQAVKTVDEALSEIKYGHYECVILNPALPDGGGTKFLKALHDDPELERIPVIIYHASGKTSPGDDAVIKEAADKIILKEAKSPDHLLAEVTLFLHQVASKMPKQKQAVLENLYKSDKPLEGKKVILADDDIRNVFALTSVLEKHGMIVIPAENGREALEILKSNPDADAVLMDVMMPEMDGYQAMRTIRKMAEFGKIPIIALTAKAMKGDREKCIDAGASDYIAKPINTNQLLSLLRVWLHK